MMAELTTFERLAEAARRDRAPKIDVAGQVVNTVEALRRPAIGASWLADSSLLAFAGLSLAAAVLVGVLALPAWESVHDPLVAFCKPLSAIFE
jgi:hypothetical protein